MFDKFNPLIERLGMQGLDQVPALKKIADKIGMGIKGSHLVLIILLFLSLSLFLNIASYFICSLVGFLYPAYKSFKAIESQNKDDDKQWLTYWVVFSFVTVFDGVFGSILQYGPFYHIIKLGLYIFLFHPQTLGAGLIYDKVIQPFLKKHEGKLDNIAKEVEKKIQKNE